MYSLQYGQGKTYHCKTVEDVFNCVRNITPEDFMDDVVNDDAGAEIYLFDKYYKPCDILKAIDREKYNKLCNQYWEDCKKDFYEYLEDLQEGETQTLYGFKVTVTREDV